MERPAPVTAKIPFSTKSCKSRVAVALDVFVRDMYFLADIPTDLYKTYT
ncbi:hypothetical protein M2306_002658 [Myroides gitamensis]|nr:hypothetical protein [Myroides gitamensis]